MKTRKRLIATLLVTALCLSLVGIAAAENTDGNRRITQIHTAGHLRYRNQHIRCRRSDSFQQIGDFPFDKFIYPGQPVDFFSHQSVAFLYSIS